LHAVEEGEFNSWVKLKLWRKKWGW
jgi:hypothetical protein